VNTETPCFWFASHPAVDLHCTACGGDRSHVELISFGRDEFVRCNHHRIAAPIGTSLVSSDQRDFVPIGDALNSYAKAKVYGPKSEDMPDLVALQMNDYQQREYRDSLPHPGKMWDQSGPALAALNPPPLTGIEEQRAKLSPADREAFDAKLTLAASEAMKANQDRKKREDLMNERFHAKMKLQQIDHPDQEKRGELLLGYALKPLRYFHTIDIDETDDMCRYGEHDLRTMGTPTRVTIHENTPRETVVENLRRILAWIEEAPGMTFGPSPKKNDDDGSIPF
jgi:hypothetical protein